MTKLGPDVLASAIKVGDEYAWALSEALHIIDKLETARCVILGIEFWEFLDKSFVHPKVLGWSEYDLDPSRKDWDSYVTRSVELARASLVKSSDIKSDSPIWCQITWVEF